jgi:hypothetical protein
MEREFDVLKIMRKTREGKFLKGQWKYFLHLCLVSSLLRHYATNTVLVFLIRRLGSSFFEQVVFALVVLSEASCGDEVHVVKRRFRLFDQIFEGNKFTLF